MINAPEAHEQEIDEILDDRVLEFGTYLPREAISAELAQTCQELKHYVAERVVGPTIESVNR
jgi:hypothetical protein